MDIKYEDALERMADAIGISLSLVAILYQLSFFFNISPDLLALVCVLLMVLSLRSITIPRGIRANIDLSSLLISVAIIIGVILWRLVQARGLAFPPWVDSPHHALIIRAIIEQKTIPEDLNPYIKMPFYYHFGFHAYAALISRILHLGIGQTMLIFGQIINASVSFSIYRLGKRLWNDRKKALACTLIVTLFSQMPGCYFSWGRYSLLTGLTILPLIMAQGFHAERHAQKHRRTIHIAILTCGLFLCHYFAGNLLLSFLVIFVLFKPEHAKGDRLWGGVLLGLLAASPWLIRGIQLSTFHSGISIDSNAAAFNSAAIFNSMKYIRKLFGPGRGFVLLIGGIIGGCIAYSRKTLRPFVSWSAFLLILCIPFPIRLDPLRPDHFAIVLFIPLSLLFVEFVFQFVRRVLTKIRLGKIENQVFSLMIAALCIWGILETAVIVNPQTLFAFRDDQIAIEWINENVPENAKFLIQATEWLGEVYGPVDGGGWIMPLTGRKTIVPPITYGFGSSALIHSLASDYKRITTVAACSEEFWEQIASEQITHIYQNTTQSSAKGFWSRADGCQNSAGMGSTIKSFQYGSVIIYTVSMEE